MELVIFQINSQIRVNNNNSTVVPCTTKRDPFVPQIYKSKGKAEQAVLIHPFFDI